MPSDEDRSYAAGSFQLALDGGSSARPPRKGILIGVSLFLLLSLSLLAFLLFGPEGDVLNFYDMFLPGDPTFVVRSSSDGAEVAFGDGVVGRRPPNGARPSCEQAMMAQGKQGNVISNVVFDAFLWANKTRLIVGSAPLCDGDPGAVTGGACNQPCDPNGSTCDPGLSCVQEPDGGFVCFGGTDSNGETCGGGQQPPLATEKSGEGQCRCNSTMNYTCVLPNGTTTVSYNATECGGSGVCICDPNDPTTLICPDGTYAPFNPACGVGDTTGGGQCSCVCDVPDPNNPGKCLQGHDTCTQAACLP